MFSIGIFSRVPSAKSSRKFHWVFFQEILLGIPPWFQSEDFNRNFFREFLQEFPLRNTYEDSFLDISMEVFSGNFPRSSFWRFLQEFLLGISKSSLWEILLLGKFLLAIFKALPLGEFHQKFLQGISQGVPSWDSFRSSLWRILRGIPSGIPPGVFY